MNHHNLTNAVLTVPDMETAYNIFKHHGVTGRLSLDGLFSDKVADVFWTCTEAETNRFYWVKLISYRDEDDDQDIGQVSIYQFKADDMFLIEGIPYRVLEDDDVGLKVLQLAFIKNEEEALLCLRTQFPEITIEEAHLFKFTNNKVDRYAWGAFNTEKGKEDGLYICNMIPYDNVITEGSCSSPIPFGSTIKQQDKTFFYDEINGKKVIWRECTVS
jgi:hypothetical protein